MFKIYYFVLFVYLYTHTHTRTHARARKHTHTYINCVILILRNVDYQFNTKYSNNMQSHYVKLTLDILKIQYKNFNKF